MRDAPDSFGTYHDLVRSSGSTTLRYGDTFRSVVTAYNFRRFTVFDRQVVGAEHRRDRGQIRSDGFEHYHIQVLRSGRMAGGAFGEEERLSPGDAIFFDATLPQRTLVSDADYVTVTLARHLVEAVVPNARRLHGRVLPRMPGGSVGEAVLSLARMAPGPAAGGDRMIVDLLAEIAGTPHARDAESADDAEAEMSRRLRAEIFIDANLARHDLDVTTVARGSGASRSALYRAFRSVGGIKEAIIRRRVARLRAAILRADEARSIKVLAHEAGFLAVSHGSRVFKDFYGVAPNHLRDEVRSGHAMARHDLQIDRMDQWYRDMNQAPDVSRR